MGQQVEKKTEKVTELRRRTREVIAKWNQRTAMKFQTSNVCSPLLRVVTPAMYAVNHIMFEHQQ